MTSRKHIALSSTKDLDFNALLVQAVDTYGITVTTERITQDHVTSVVLTLEGDSMEVDEFYDLINTGHYSL